MNARSTKGFGAKHGEGAVIDENVREAVAAKAKDGSISCAAAFVIAHGLAMSPAEVGRAVDLMEYRLTHCQLGLFGYQPKKKMVTPAADVPEALASAIRDALVSDRLPCRAAWGIAEAMGVGKCVVSGACETLGIKIKPCQLGAF